MSVPQVGGHVSRRPSPQGQARRIRIPPPVRARQSPADSSRNSTPTADQRIYVSATPADYELKESEGLIVEQVVRPTGLVDPEVEIRPATNQVDDLLDEIRAVRGAANASSSPR